MRSTDGKVRGTDITDLSTNAYIIIMCHVSHTSRPTPHGILSFRFCYDTVRYYINIVCILLCIMGVPNVPCVTLFIGLSPNVLRIDIHSTICIYIIYYNNI